MFVGFCVNLFLFLTVQLEKLSIIQSQPESQLKFITDAWLQVSFSSSSVDFNSLPLTFYCIYHCFI